MLEVAISVLGAAEEEYARESLKVAENFLNANIEHLEYRIKF